MFRHIGWIALSLVLAVLPLDGSALAADLEREVVLDIPAQSLEFALLKLSEQSGVQIQMASSDVPELQVAGLSGRMPVSKALASLLNQTGLSYQVVGESTVAIYRDRRANRAGKLRVDTLMASNAPAALPPQASRVTETARSEASGLQGVIVTARRQEESLQETPIAVTAVTGELLDQLNVQNISRVADLAPNLTISQLGSSTTSAAIQIRGIGSSEPASTTEAAVGLYLDGVYIARSTAAVFDLVDLDRVEVLRGPQGTLFGRNTTGGAVQLVSKKPADKFGLEEKAGYGRFNDWYTRTRIDTGFIAGSPVKATIAYLHLERDGFFDNILSPNGRDPGSFNNDAVWVSFMGEFGNRFTASYSFDYNERDGAPWFFQIVAATPDVMDYFGRSPSFGGAPFVMSRERLKSGQQLPFDGDRLTSTSESVGHNLTIEAKLSDTTTIKSISSYRSFKQYPYCNMSGNGQLRGPVLDPVTFQFSGIQDLYGPFTCDNTPQWQLQYSEELQLLGGSGDWNYVAGLFYFYERAYEHNQQRFTFVLPGGQAALNLTPLQALGGETESIAGFGQVSYRPTVLDSKLELTGGLRYTQDDKEFFSSNFPERPKKSFSNASWLASASYQFADDVMGYARISTAYRAGGFSPRSTTLSAFDPEEATAYELGLKAEWFDRRLRTNLSLFQTDYKDLQVNQFASGTSGASAIVVNAGEATFKGFELEFVALLAKGLTADVSYGYVDPKYDKYQFRNPVTDELSDVSREARFSNVAKENLHIGAEYAINFFGIGKFSTRVDWSKRGRRYFYPLDSINIFNDEIKDPGTENLSARIALSELPLGSYGSWELGIWGENLTDHDNVGYAIDFGGLGFGGLFYTEPRRYGVDVRLRF